MDYSTERGRMICASIECDTTFDPKNRLHRYCSQKCKRREADRRQRENAPERFCAREDCGVGFRSAEKLQKYCSQTCSAIVNNEKYPKRVRQDKVLTCKTCGTSFRGKYNRIYCTRVCADDEKKIRRKREFDEWVRTGSDWSYANHYLPARAREMLLEEAGNKCTRCGWCEPNPKLGKPILCIDHINGNWKDNRRDNLVVLCYNCHTLTPTFNALNVGSASGRRPGEGKRRNMSL